MVIFEANAGAVVRLKDSGIACQINPMTISGRRSQVDYAMRRSIVSRVAVSRGTNVQFQHTLGQRIFIYAFGDRVGTLMLAGISFLCPCADRGNGSSVEHGGQLMLEWYEANRASRRPDPIIATIGDYPLVAYLTEFNLDILDPASTLIQWTANLKLIPEEL